MGPIIRQFKLAVTALAVSAAPVVAQEAPAFPRPEMREGPGPWPDAPMPEVSPSPPPNGADPDATAERGADPEPLIDQLRNATPDDAARIERELQLVWSRSGSPVVDLLLRRGEDALKGGDVETAIGHLTALTDHAPDFAQGWHVRAMAFFRQEEFGLALHDLRRTLALNPDNYAAIYGLAVVMEQLDRIGPAHDLYRRVLALHPNHADATEGLQRLDPRVDGTEI